jgi:hypothetical protein
MKLVQKLIGRKEDVARETIEMPEKDASKCPNCTTWNLLSESR